MNWKLFAFLCFCLCALANLLGLVGVTATVFPVLGGYAATQAAPIVTAYCVLVIFITATVGLFSAFMSVVVRE